MKYQDSRKFLISAITPRPIAWVSTIGENGVFNLAPFSFFCPVSSNPPMLGFNANSNRDGTKKDTLRNIEFAKEYVINVVNEELGQQMNQSSQEYPPDVSEFKEVGLTPIKADRVKAPLVAEAPVSMECRLTQILEFGKERKSYFIIGELLMAHVKDELWVNGQVDQTKLRSIARMGGEWFCRTRDVFELKRPYPYP
ncbi:MAG: flavin reductase family protein [Chloroflexi bacterium]|nr:flavin reductase family protein [Chloroflexota bacterium]